MITLENDHLRVDISPLGAEMQRIVDGGGRDRLWHGDPAFWTGRAPVLFPVAGSLKNGQYTYQGKTYALPQHGFARKRTFAVEAAAKTEVTFLLENKEGDEEGYPFPYALRVRYVLRGPAIDVIYQVSNIGQDTLYFGIGAHEAYACPEGIEAYELIFSEPETLERMTLSGASVDGGRVPVALENNALLLKPSLFANDTLVFDQHRSRSVTLKHRETGLSVQVDFADFAYLLIWTLPGAGYLCIEPWSNLPDHVDTDGDITRKPGMAAVAPGSDKSLTHTITFS